MQEPSAGQEQLTLVEAKLKIENRFKGGANWFYWIAGLSIINTVIFLLGSDWSFVVGLGITQVVDGVVAGLASYSGGGNAIMVKVGAFLINATIAGIFALFGVLSRQRSRGAFIIGMVLYALDAFIFVAVGAWLSVAFHAFALFGLWGGLRALGQLNELEKHLETFVSDAG